MLGPIFKACSIVVFLKHFQEEMPSVKTIDPNIPQSLENVVLHATAKDPADRYKTAEEMSRDLYTVLAANRLNEPKKNFLFLSGQTRIFAFHLISILVRSIDAANGYFCAGFFMSV